jgi:hypothetical protein
MGSTGFLNRLNNTNPAEAYANKRTKRNLPIMSGAANDTQATTIINRLSAATKLQQFSEHEM